MGLGRVVQIILILKPQESGVLQIFEKDDIFHSGIQNLKDSEVPAVKIDYGTFVSYNVKPIVSIPESESHEFCT